MRIAGDDVDKPLIEHPLGPIARPCPERPDYGPRSELREGAMDEQTPEEFVVRLDPAQSLRVGDYWHIAGLHEALHQV